MLSVQVLFTLKLNKVGGSAKGTIKLTRGIHTLSYTTYLQIVTPGTL